MKILTSALLGATALTLVAFGAAQPAQAHPDGWGVRYDPYQNYCRDYWYRQRYASYCNRYYDNHDSDDNGQSYYNNYNYQNYENDDRRYRDRDGDNRGHEGEQHHRHHENEDQDE